MSWKKHIQTVSKNKKLQDFMAQNSKVKDHSPAANTGSKYSSFLPEVYAGHPQRIMRYDQYDIMDQDSEINAALDTIADFCTRPDDLSGNLFKVRYLSDADDTEIEIISDLLKKWVAGNKFKTRLWRIFRSTLKYGDQFFIRDPETMKWYWVDQSKVKEVYIDETNGKKPDKYIVYDLDFNLDFMTASMGSKYGSNIQGTGTNSLQPFNNTQGAGYFSSPSPGVTRIGNQRDSYEVDATHMIHISLSEGLDANWPFGTSILEPIFKVFKQKELLEDAIIIYRIQRAPERRIFYIDVGDMNLNKANAYIEKVKMEVHQRKIPSRNGKGSSVMDAAYNPLCLDMNTRIPLLDGRTLSIYELMEEYNSGKENWTYSCDPITGKIVPGNITWAGYTRKNAKVLKLHLDNGETLIMTPDHKVPVLGKGFIEAQHLTSDDSLISYETRYKSLSKDKNRSYHQIFDHETNKWVFTHRMVGNFFKNINKHQEFTYLESFIGKEKDTVHHKDFDRYNNDPRNLTWMNKTDHVLYHSDTKKNYWENISPEESERIKEKIRNSLENHRNNRSIVDTEKRSNNCSIAQKNRWRELDRTTEKYKKYTEGLRSRRVQHYIDNPDKKEKFINGSKKYQEAPWCNVKFVWTRDMLNYFTKMVKDGNYDRLGAIAAANNDQKFLDMLIQANPKPEKGKFGITYDFQNSKLKTMYKQFGFNNWKDFKSKVNCYNHRITHIEWVEETMNTGCITVDGNERWHGYHTFATESGIFVKNSIMEDYYFAQSPDGRGSKVEVLPGGENLGCFSMDTKIKLSDGRDLTISEIETELKQGNELWSYSVDPISSEIVLGKIDWAGKTRKNTNVIKITLDNGENIVCTPDHKFPIRGYGFMEAGKLTEGQSLIGFYDTDETYYDTIRNEYVNKNDIKKTSAYDSYINYDSTDVYSYKNRLTKFVENYRNNIFEETYVDKFYDNIIIGDVISDNIIVSLMTKEYKRGGVSTSTELFEKLNNDVNFTNHYYNLNLKPFDINSIDCILKNVGLNWNTFVMLNTNIIDIDKIKEIRNNSEENCLVNHRIIKIEKLEEKMDVGTISIDINEEYHDYHTFALSVGVFTKNSIDDLKYFNNKLVRGLRVPSSYLPTGPEDSQTQFTDGRVGTAYIQEYRFANYCQRLQQIICEKFDTEFKLFMKQRGYNIDSSIFDLELIVPQNFRQFSQLDKDNLSVALFNNLSSTKYLSKKFILGRYLGLTEEEILKNEQMWLEENDREDMNEDGEENYGLDRVGINPTDYDEDDDMT